MLLDYILSFCENQKCSQTLSNIPWGQSCLQLRLTDSVQSQAKSQKNFKNCIWWADTKIYLKELKRSSISKTFVKNTAFLDNKNKETVIMAVWYWCRDRYTANGADYRVLKTNLCCCYLSIWQRQDFTLVGREWTVSQIPAQLFVHTEKQEIRSLSDNMHKNKSYRN